MSEIKENFFENNALFKFDTYSCDMVTDVIHTSPNEEPSYNYKISANSLKPITLAYAPKQGLVRINKITGSIEESNILGRFISLCDKPEKELIKFMNDNGFIFPVEIDNYETIKKEELLNILTRLKLTVELMSNISSIKKDYHKIVLSIINLLFYRPVEFTTDSMQSTYTTHHYDYVDLLKSSGDTLSDKRKQQEFNSDVYTIENDTIFPNYEINIADYNDIICSAIPSIFKNIMCLYVGLDSKNTIERKITDVLYHSLKECKSLESFGNTKNSLKNISDNFQKTIIDVAKYIIGEEINSNLNRIYPVYNMDKMTPSWKIDDLLSALYFSIFYLNSELELYRQCANPRCSKWFLVRTTTTKKKYCSQECCNRVTQDKYRKNKRIEEKKKKSV